ncbi:RNA-directed DNA polymerase, eukaryota [Tanacetum coccineum]
MDGLCHDSRDNKNSCKGYKRLVSYERWNYSLLSCEGLSHIAVVELTLLVTINNDRRCEVKYRQIQEVLVDIPERITEHGLSSENTQSSGGSSDASEGIPCIESLLAMCLLPGRAVGHDRAVWQELNNISLTNQTEKVALRSQRVKVESGVGVPQSLVTQAASLIGCGIMQKPFWYLGVMVGDYRRTLLKSVLGASPLYNMSIYRVPKGVLKEMEAIRSNFFIGADTLERKIAWVSWDKVLASKKKGGLGVSSFHALNRALLLKWVWRFLSQDGSLWFPRLFALETDKEASVASKLGSSSIDVSFRRSVREGVEREQWNDLNSLSSVTLSSSKDRWICDLNGEGVFRVKEIRIILDDIFLPSDFNATRWVKYIPIKVNVFAWRARLDRLPTRCNLIRRGVVLDSSLCPMCGLVPEDIHHILFRCDIAQLVFRRICRWWDLDWQDLMSFSDWGAWFSDFRFSSRLKLILKGVFYTAWWHLWAFRNQTIFAVNPPRRYVIIDDIVSYSFNWCSSRCNSLFSLESWMENHHLISL